MTNDELLLVEAYTHAGLHSDDLDTWNGAVIVAPGGRKVFGTNRLPRKVLKASERLDRPEKYLWIEHAERDAIYAAAKDGVALFNAIMYCPWFACTDCARAIIQSGISKIVGHETPLRLTPERWREPISKARRMLEEAGVRVQVIQSVLGVTTRFNGHCITV